MIQKKQNKEKLLVREKWRKVAQIYTRALPPNRPSSDDCLIYAKNIARILKNKKAAKVLLMGSSPRIRDILRDLSLNKEIRVFCLDLTPEMYQAMTSLVYVKNPKEKFVKGNWLQIPFEKNYFDLVIGDEVICNVENKRHDQLFAEVRRILKDSGFWLTRHNFFTPAIIKFNLPLFLLKQTKATLRGEITGQQVGNNISILSMYRLFYKEKENKPIKLNNMFKYYNKVKEEAIKIAKPEEKIMIEKTYRNFISAFYDMKTVQWSGLSKQESEKELNKHFRILRRGYSNDYISAKFSPIYLLSPRK